MKRYAWLLLILAGLMLAPSKEGIALPLPWAATALQQSDGVMVAGDKQDREGADVQQGDGEGRQKLRRGFGARLWGGPYWGYGPSWGRRCENCRTECEGEASDSPQCKRCRARCGG